METALLNSLNRAMGRLVLTGLIVGQALFGNAQAFTHFITREGDLLREGNQVFRFISVNAPNVTGHYDGYKNTNPESGYVYDPMELSYEMEASFKEMAQMGVTVIRTWGITVADGSGEFEALVEGPGKYNETAFRRIDKMLQLANKYRIRVILCLVKENKYWGSTASFSTLYGGGDYYAALAVKQGFKDLLSTFVNRKNHFTGVSYRNDKAIMAWEFGNEVPNSKVAWIAEMADYLKNIDPNHLIADPRRANGVQQMKRLVEDVVTDCPKIDILKTRQYPNYQNSVAELWAECAGKRPLIIDEFQKMEGFEQVLEQVVTTPVTGALLWSLMKPQIKGGIGGHALFHSYSWGGSRWPGFDSGDYFNESGNLMLIREYGYKIRGLKTPALPAPSDAPHLYNTVRKDAVALKWRSSPGARYYVVERAPSAKGPWRNISGDFDISYNLYYYPMFSDTTVVPGSTYYYRVTGKNSSGISAASNVMGPVVPSVKMAMDNLKDFSLAYSHNQNLRISSESWPRLRQTEEDFFQAERIKGAGSGELIYRADALKWVELVAFGEPVESLSLEYSADGKLWKPIPPGGLIKTHRSAYPSQISGTNDNPVDKYTYTVPTLPANTVAVKIVTGNGGAATTFPWIARVHLGYTGSLKSATQPTNK